MTDLPPYSHVRPAIVPPDVQVDYIIQKQNEDQITVQTQQAQAAASQPPTGQNR